MNRIYKVIWNKARGMYVVVSELAKTRGKASSTGLKRTALLAAALLLLSGAVAPQTGMAETLKEGDTSIRYDANGIYAGTEVGRIGNDGYQKISYALDKSQVKGIVEARTQDNGIDTTVKSTYDGKKGIAETWIQVGGSSGASATMTTSKDGTTFSYTENQKNTSTTIQGNTVSTGTINAGIVKATTLQDASGHAVNLSDVAGMQTELARKVNAADVYSKAYTDAAFATKSELSGKADASDVYTKDAVNKAIADANPIVGSVYKGIAADKKKNEALGKNSTVTGGFKNQAEGDYSSVSGGQANKALGTRSSVSGGVQNEAQESFSSVSGGQSNIAKGKSSSVSGGVQNEAQANFSSVSGGRLNKASAESSSVSGGIQNEAQANFSSVSGGQLNKARAESSSVSGGALNEAQANWSSVSAGYKNIASKKYSSVSGGRENQANGEFSSVNGGIKNASSGKYAAVASGYGNVAKGDYTAVAGGIANLTEGNYAFVGGGYKNTATGIVASVYGGSENIASGNYATAIGGVKGEAAGLSSVTIGGAKTEKTAEAAVAIGKGSVATEKYQISFGDAADVTKNHKLTNIADGKNDHDAVTVAQLKTKADSTTVAANTSTIAQNTNKLNDHSTRIEALEAIASKGGQAATVDAVEEAHQAAKDAQSSADNANKAAAEAHQAARDVDGKINTEISERKAADASLQQSLGTKADQSALEVEQEAREAGDTALQGQIDGHTQTLSQHGDAISDIQKELKDIDADTLRAEGQAAKTAADNAQARADEAHQAATEAKETADKMQSSVHNTLKISDDNVLQKQTVTTSEQGEVTTAATDASTLIINKGKNNQIQFNENEGIVVGLSSTKMDAEGFTAGSHDYGKAGSALMADGRIKGANGNFTVDASGKVSAKGVDAGGEKITNVAAGTEATDAVNVSQLSQTDQRVSNVENRISRLDNRVDKVGANAAAMANLHPMDYDADSKLNVAAAVGNYGSASAAALGVFYQPNERVMMNLSTSFGNGENMVGAGVAFKLGHIEKTKKEENVSPTDLSQILNQLQALQARQTQLEQENAALKAKVAELEKK